MNNFGITLRPWQDNAAETIGHALMVPHSITSVNACVGSGKTFVPFAAIVKYIELNPDSKSFHTFVCPTIKLCVQQAREARKFFEDRGIKVSVKIWNSDSDDVENRRVSKDEFWGSDDQHILCVICDESLWGISKTRKPDGSDIKKCRFDRFAHVLENNEKFGRKNGIIAYDEAHNYSQKQKYMFGKELHKRAER